MHFQQRLETGLQLGPQAQLSVQVGAIHEALEIRRAQGQAGLSRCARGQEEHQGRHEGGAEGGESRNAVGGCRMRLVLHNFGFPTAGHGRAGAAKEIKRKKNYPVARRGPDSRTPDPQSNTGWLPRGRKARGGRTRAAPSAATTKRREQARLTLPGVAPPPPGSSGSNQATGHRCGPLLRIPDGLFPLTPEATPLSMAN